jgi:hypothetical protein
MTSLDMFVHQENLALFKELLLIRKLPTLSVNCS